MALFALNRLRLIIALGPAGGWDKFGDLAGASGKLRAVTLRLLSKCLEVCIEDNMDGMARLAVAEIFRLAHTTRGRADSDEVRRFFSEPDRDRRLRVVDGLRRSYQRRQSHAWASRYCRNDRPGTRRSSTDNGHERTSKRDRKRHGIGKSSGAPAPAVPTGGE